jgi:ribonucleoside-triphosphate reductase
VILLKVTKRNGKKVPFEKDKIRLAVSKAFFSVDGEETSYAKDKAREIANYTKRSDRTPKKALNDIQNAMEEISERSTQQQDLF